jgi:uncharacterized protein involved in exopolysaccharide biosynthesis
MKRFLFIEVIVLSLLGAYWTLGPKQHVCGVELTAVVHAPSERSLGDYAPADDTQITGTIARGFHDRRVLEAVAGNHARLGLDANAVLKATTVSINSFSRTIHLDVAASSPQLAATLATALLDERSALNNRLWQEEKAADLRRVEAGIVSLEQQLQQHRAALQALGEQAGDPLEREDRLREKQRRGSQLENLQADLTVRANRYQSMLALLETALADIRAGKNVPPSSGFEMADTYELQTSGKGGTNLINLVSRRSSGVSEAWSEVLNNSAELAALEAAYGGQHAEVIAARKALAGSRQRLMDEFQAQKEALKVALESVTAAGDWLNKETAANEEQIRALGTARFNPEYVKLRQTISGLESALRKAVSQRQMLASATLTNPPQFYVIEPPSTIDLPVQPTLMACIAASQVVAIVLLWLTSGWTRKRPAVG